MLQPSLGRIVIFRLPPGQPAVNGAHEHPAIITRIWSDTCVNLHVLFDAAPSQPVTSVMHADVPGHAGSTWSWPERV